MCNLGGGSGIARRPTGSMQVCPCAGDWHHHAAVEAAWGAGTDSAFAEARFALILTGTPIRTDGAPSVWLAYDDAGAIDRPEAGTYTLTYGEAVEDEVQVGEEMAAPVRDRILRSGDEQLVRILQVCRKKVSLVSRAFCWISLSRVSPIQLASW